MIRILTTAIFLLCFVACDARYVIRFNGDDQKMINTACGKIIVSCTSMGYVSYQYFVRVIPNDQVLVRLNDVSIFLNERERDYDIWYQNKLRNDLDSLYIESDTKFTFSFTRDYLEEVNEIGINADNFLISGSKACGFGPLYQPVNE